MGKYRQLNEKPNAKCDKCNNDIWVRSGIYTIYNGYQDWANYTTFNPESAVIMKEGVITRVCWPCFEKWEGK